MSHFDYVVDDRYRYVNRDPPVHQHRDRSEHRSERKRYSVEEFGPDPRASFEDARVVYSRDPRASFEAFDDTRTEYSRDPRSSFEKSLPAPLSYKRTTNFVEGDFEVNPEPYEYGKDRSRSSSVPSGPRKSSVSKTKKTLFIVTALHPWTGDHPGDLDLKPGDMIKVTEDINAEWLRGHNSKTKGYGVFPKNYVVEIGNSAEYTKSPPLTGGIS